MPFLALLTGPLGKYAGYVALAIGLLVAAAGALHAHDNALRAEIQAASDRAIATAQVASAAHEVTALEAQAKANAETINRLNAIREATHAAPKTTACATSPAVRSLLDGLRGHAPGGPGAQH